MRRRLTQLAFGVLLLAPAAPAARQGPPPSPSMPAAKPKQPAGDADAAPPPASAEEDVQVAGYYIRKGDPDAATPRLQEAIQLKPNWAKPRLMLGEVYEKKGDTAAAVKCYKDYLQAFPNAADAKKVQKKIEKLESQ
ncbi:MAG TPA: tetratricopeptide repeat protein [Verrucomicrobiae bacterium]|nr:tetratricopeptide repeat protein [Verrucomicrobiae bacterium]